MSCGVFLEVSDASAIGEARRLAADVADRVGFDAESEGQLSIVITEATSNIVKHAGRGELVVSAVRLPDFVGVEVLALDRGPGMPDVERCLRDGYSTAGSPGTGMGAIARLCARHDLYSREQGGTVLMARVAARRTPPRGTSRFEVGAVNLPHPGEKECGDGWAWFEEGQRAAVFVADGLGHGPAAASAARAAVERFLERVAQTPEEILQSVHGVLRPTRGAAAVAAVIDPVARELTFAGVGNVAGAILGPGTTRSLLGHNGTLGHEARKILPYRYPVPARGLLVLNTDGLVTQWRLDAYPGLAARHPSVIAGVLYRDFRRLRDDVTAVVIRIREEGS